MLATANEASFPWHPGWIQLIHRVTRGDFMFSQPGVDSIHTGKTPPTQQRYKAFSSGGNTNTMLHHKFKHNMANTSSATMHAWLHNSPSITWWDHANVTLNCPLKLSQPVKPTTANGYTLTTLKGFKTTESSRIAVDFHSRTTRTKQVFEQMRLKSRLRLTVICTVVNAEPWLLRIGFSRY